MPKMMPRWPASRPELVERVEHDQRAAHRVEEVAQRRTRRDAPQQRMLQHEAQALADLDVQRPAARSWGRLVDVADPADEQRRAEEAEGVERDRHGRADELDQPAGDGRTRDHRDRLGGLELGVAVTDLVRLHDLRQVALVGDVEEHRARPDHERDPEQLDQGEPPEGPRQREGGQGSGADQVVGHEHAPTPPPVDPGAGRQADDEEGQELAGAEQAHLEGVRVQHVDREHRHRQHRQLGARRAGRLGQEQLPEVVVTEQPGPATAGCLEGHGTILAH